MGPEFGPNINVEDHTGVRPIHLAAIISEELVARLIQMGADPFAVTHEGRNLLHAAARARQSNVVGLLLEYYFKIDHVDLPNSSDERGRPRYLMQVARDDPRVLRFSCDLARIPTSGTKKNSPLSMFAPNLRKKNRSGTAPRKLFRLEEPWTQ